MVQKLSSKYNNPLTLLKNKKIIFAVGPLFFLLFLALFLNIIGNKKKIPKPTSYLEIFTPRPTTLLEYTPKPENEIVDGNEPYRFLKTESHNIIHKEAFKAKRALKLEFKLPIEWEVKPTKGKNASDYVIRNCQNFNITDRENTIRFSIKTICTKYSPVYSDIPSDNATSLEQKRQTKDGNVILLRVRYPASSNFFKYGDVIFSASETFDSKEDKISDVVFVGFAPPNESTENYITIPFIFEGEFNGKANLRKSFYRVMDTIASSLVIK